MKNSEIISAGKLGEKSIRGIPPYANDGAGGFITAADKPWPNEARHNVNPIIGDYDISGGSNGL